MTEIDVFPSLFFVCQIDTMLERLCLKELTRMRTETIAGGHYSRTGAVFTSE